MSGLAPPRRAHIIEQVQLRDGMRVSEPTRLLGVSGMLIRRDLDLDAQAIMANRAGELLVACPGARPAS